MQFVYAGTSGCSQNYRHTPIALYSLLNVAPDDRLMIVRNMYSHLTKKLILFTRICASRWFVYTGWRTKCHTIDCTHNTFLFLQKHLISGTELILIAWKIVYNESL